MLTITKSVITPYTPTQMYALVSDVANYKNYLPWCPSSEVLKTGENKVVGRVDISYLKVKAHFTTENTNISNERIDMNLVDGPFKHLQGHWKFIPLGENGCKIEFKLDYKFSNFIIEKVIGTVFEIVIKSIVDSFVKKAHEIYRK
jgi:ribosome-associated toxin RatA of RatAB toxin-antitoxin module